MKPIEDKDYEAFERELASIDVPKERLAVARTESFRRHQQEKRRRKRAWQSVALVAVLALVFVTSFVYHRHLQVPSPKFLALPHLSR